MKGHLEAEDPAHLPGAAAAEPAPPRTAPLQDGAALMSMGREQRAFALGDSWGAEAAPHHAPPAPAPASLDLGEGQGVEPGGDARGWGSDSSSEVMRTTVHGEFFHCESMVNGYRVASEGDGGTGLSTAIYDSLTRVSLERQFRLPSSMWGEWPSFAKRPAIGLGKAAKVYLDAACLEEGEPWEAGATGTGGFAGALRCSVVFLPLMSFTQDGGGSLGQMMRLASHDFCDNVLLEFTVALGVWKSKRMPLRAIIPVLVGQKDTRGIYSTFPFGEVSKLPDTPSVKTNQRAAEILRRFGLEEEAARVHGSTVRGVVSSVLAFQGVQLSNEGVHSKAVRAVAERTLVVARRHVVEGMEELLAKERKVKTLTIGTPCGYEVLDWLRERGMSRYAAGMAAERIDSLPTVSNLTRADAEAVVGHTMEGLRSRLGGAQGGADGPSAGDEDGGWGGGDEGVMGEREALLLPKGDVIELEVACRSLKGDRRAMTMQERLRWYSEESELGSTLAISRAEGFEAVIMSKRMTQLLIPINLVWPFFLVVPFLALWSQRFTVWPHGSDIVFMVMVAIHEYGSLVVQLLVWPMGRLSPPYAFEGMARMHFVNTVASGLGVWAVQSLYFTGDDAIPDTFLRHVRYPLWFASQLAVAFIMRFARSMLISYSNSYHVITHAVHCVGCFLGEDPDSNIVAWVFLGLLLMYLINSVSVFQSQRRVASDAVKHVAPEREAFGRAWKEVLAAEGAESAARGLSEACAEVRAALTEEVRAFEASLPRFGPHVWWAGVPLVREGLLFTSSGKPRQAVSDLDVLFQQARVLNPHFQDWVKSWAGWGGGQQYVPGPVKHAGRVIEKCIRVYQRDAAAITDLVRCTVIYPTLQGVLSFFLAIRERSDHGGVGMVRIRRIKNRLDMEFNADAESVGYRDLALLVEVGWLEKGGVIEFVPVKDWGIWGKTTSRHICEIQAHVSTVYEVSRGGLHDKYVAYRDLIMQ